MLKKAEMKRFVRKVSGKRISQDSIQALNEFLERLLIISAQLAEHSHRSTVSHTDIRFALALSQPTKAEPVTIVRERPEKIESSLKIEPKVAEEKPKPEIKLESTPEPAITASSPALPPVTSPSPLNSPETAASALGVGVIRGSAKHSTLTRNGEAEPARNPLQQWRTKRARA